MYGTAEISGLPADTRKDTLGSGSYLGGLEYAEGLPTYREQDSMSPGLLVRMIRIAIYQVSSKSRVDAPASCLYKRVVGLSCLHWIMKCLSTYISFHP